MRSFFSPRQIDDHECNTYLVKHLAPVFEEWNCRLRLVAWQPLVGEEPTICLRPREALSSSRRFLSIGQRHAPPQFVRVPGAGDDRHPSRACDAVPPRSALMTRPALKTSPLPCRTPIM